LLNNLAFKKCNKYAFTKLRQAGLKKEPMGKVNALPGAKDMEL
jgi:hypothetical protein